MVAKGTLNVIYSLCVSLYVGNYTQNRKLWKKENIYFIQNNSGIKGIYELITKYCTEWVQQLFLFANCIWQSYPISHSLIPQIVTHSTMTCNKNCKLQHGNKSLLGKNCMVSCVMFKNQTTLKVILFSKTKTRYTTSNCIAPQSLTFFFFFFCSKWTFVRI